MLKSLLRSLLLPLHLIQEYRNARSLRCGWEIDEFDLQHSVETQGEFQGWTYLSDLDIPSPNWIHGTDYAAIEPERFAALISALSLDMKQFTFVDFGSGKGRAVLLASEHPFNRIIGLEFAPELHAVAKRNVEKYRTTHLKCRDIELRNLDFVDFEFPPGPLVLFFFNPCRARVLVQVLKSVQKSLQHDPRPLWLIYIAPQPEHEQVLREIGIWASVALDNRWNCLICSTQQCEPLSG